MTYLNKSELLSPQSEWHRTQVRIPPALSKAMQAYAEENNLSLNSAMIDLLDKGLTNNDKATKRPRKIIFNQFSGASYHEVCNSVSEFFRTHSDYELISLDFLPGSTAAIRFWYSYPAPE